MAKGTCTRNLGWVESMNNREYFSILNSIQIYIQKSIYCLISQTGFYLEPYNAPTVFWENDKRT